MGRQRALGKRQALGTVPEALARPPDGQRSLCISPQGVSLSPVPPSATAHLGPVHSMAGFVNPSTLQPHMPLPGPHLLLQVPFPSPRGRRRQCLSVQGMGPLGRDKAHRQEGMDDVGFDGAQGLVLDDQEDLLLLLEADEVPEPGLLGQPAGWSEGLLTPQGQVCPAPDPTILTSRLPPEF